jgi:hypothetical protein
MTQVLTTSSRAPSRRADRHQRGTGTAKSVRCGTEGQPITDCSGRADGDVIL